MTPRIAKPERVIRGWDLAHLPTPPILDPFAIVSRAANGRERRLPTARWSETTAGSIVNRRHDPDARRPTRITLKGRVPSGLFRASLCWQAAETKEAQAVPTNRWFNGICGT